MIEKDLGWIAPDGSFFKCDWLDHVAEAEEICNKYGWEDWPTPDETLFSHGFVKITYSVIFQHYYIFLGDNKHLSQFQKPIIKDYLDSGIRINPICKEILLEELE